MNRRALLMIGIALLVLVLGTWTMLLPNMDQDVSQVLMLVTYPPGIFLLVDGGLLLVRGRRLRQPRSR